jgi:hypothetical protein
MGIEERLRRLEAERGPKLCEERYCMRAPPLWRSPTTRTDRKSGWVASRPRCVGCAHTAMAESGGRYGSSRFNAIS